MRPFGDGLVYCGPLAPLEVRGPTLKRAAAGMQALCYCYTPDPMESEFRSVVGRRGLEPRTSALSRRERRSVEYATANDVARGYQLCEFETAAARGVSYPGGGGGKRATGCQA